MTRRELFVLVVLVLLGAAASVLLREARPLGRDVGDSALAAAILEVDRYPQARYGAADVTLVLFTDYRCAACRKADGPMRRAIARDGNVRVVYRDWPIFGERSERAAAVALAAQRQGIYPAVHYALMRLPELGEAAQRRAVEAAGGSWAQLQDDLARETPEIAQKLAETSQDAFGLGLQGTPGYLIGPFVIQGALSEKEFLRAFAQARAASGKSR